MVKVTYTGKMNIGGSGIGTTSFHQVKPLVEADMLETVYSPGIELSRLFKNPAEATFKHVTTPDVGGPYEVQDIFFDGFVSTVMERTPNPEILMSWANHCLFTMRSLPFSTTIVTLHSAHPTLTESILKHEVGWRPRELLTLKCAKELEECNHILTSSEWVRNSLIPFGLEYKAKIIPLGADLERFHPGEKTDDTFRVIFVGSNWIQKGLLYLLEAWKNLKLKDAELVIAGIKQEVGQQIIKQIMKTHIPNIKWGWFSRDELAAAYRNSDVMCLPSLQDGFGLVVVEAMASGIPVIVSENTGASQHVYNGREGFVVPAKSVSALETYIEALYHDRAQARKMGKRGVKMAENFTWERSEREYLKWMQSL